MLTRQSMSLFDFPNGYPFPHFNKDFLLTEEFLF
jgi:hypothetical protein